MQARDGTTLMSFVGHPVGEGPFGVVMERTPYLRIDTSNAAYVLSARDFMALVNIHTPDHIIFGTDWPWFDREKES